MNNYFTLSLVCFSFIFSVNAGFGQTVPSCDDFFIMANPPGPDNWASFPCANDGTLEIEVMGGTPPFTYEWSNGATTPNLDSLAAESVHQVTVTDANGCVVVSEELLMHHEIGIISPHFAADVNGPTVRFIDETNSNSEIVNWEWTLSGSTDLPPMPNLPIFEYTFLQSDTFNVTLTVTDECGETSSHSSLLIIAVNSEEAFTFNIQGATGAVGDTLAIPVSVGNFNNILGFQKSIRLLEAQTAKIVGFKNFTLANLTLNNFEQKTDELWSMVWFTQDAISLPDESIIYEILVVLTNAEGGCSLLTFDNSEITLAVIQESDVNNTPVTIENPWVRTAEACIAGTVSLGGQITTTYGAPIANVNLYFSDSISTNSGENGQYFLSDQPVEQDFSVRPFKANAPLDNVTALDLLVILKHILNRETLATPYKLIAADVVLDLDISVLDIITLQQYILGRIDAFPGGNWVFIPQDYNFPTAQPNPLQVSYPTSKSIINLQSDKLDLDFYGIQIGDVSY